MSNDILPNIVLAIITHTSFPRNTDMTQVVDDRLGHIKTAFVQIIIVYHIQCMT